MIVRAANDFNIDLENSWMIGDGENDVKAGNAAGCKTALIRNNELELDCNVFDLFNIIKGIIQERQ